jgi:hypothetical protein
MNLAPREKRTIVIGAILVAVVIIPLYVVKPLLNRGGGRAASSQQQQQQNEFARQRERILKYESVSRQVESLQKDLGVEVSHEPGYEQMSNLVEQLGQLSGRAQVPINNLQQLKSRTRGGSDEGTGRAEMVLKLTGKNFVSVVRFLDNLEDASFPVAFDQLTINASGGGGGDSRDRSRGRGRQIQGSLQIHTYLFPEKDTP